MNHKFAPKTLKNVEILSTGDGNAPPQKFSTYLKSPETAWYRLTMATAVITVAVVFLIPENLYPWIYSRYILGAVFVLWLPGHSLIKLIFPLDMPIKMSTENLEKVEYIALSIGASLAIAPLIGLLLNYSILGIRPAPVILSLLTFTVLISTAAVVRDYLATSAKT